MSNSAYKNSVSLLVFILLLFTINIYLILNVTFLQDLYVATQKTVTSQEDEIQHLHEKVEKLESVSEKLVFQVQTDALPSNFVYLFRDVSRGLASNKTRVDVVLKLPIDIYVVEQRPGNYVLTFPEEGSTEYLLEVNLGGPQPCNFKDSLPTCGYTDEDISTENLSTTIRIWERNGKIFALNLPEITIEGYETDHLIISKRQPGETFTNQEVDYWKDLLIKNIRVTQGF